MAKRTREFEAPQGGMSLSARFTLFMTLSLAAVTSLAGVVLYIVATQVTTTVQEGALCGASRLTSQNQKVDSEKRRLTAERDLLVEIDRQATEAFPTDNEILRLRAALKTKWDDRVAKLRNLEAEIVWHQVEGKGALEYEGGQITRFPIEIGPGKDPANLFRFKGANAEEAFDILAPATAEDTERGLLGIIIGMTVVVIAVGALVSVLVGSQVSGPIEAIAQDVRQISTGDLTHKTRARGVREVNVLARSIDRMTADLAAAQVARLELSVREREVALAAEVRESLLANATPKREGYEFAALGMSAANLGGDFHDFISTPGGGVGLLVCDVSGRGLPGTLVGATARAYLRAELTRGDDLRQALFHVNRELARDVRRGMYVSAMYVLLDPKTKVARIACAGHKLPLVHFVAATGKVALVQPEGIALGFDPGPIFEGRLELAELQLQPGDRLAIFNSGPAALVNAEGKEFGEKQIYAQVQRHGARASEEFLERVRSVLEAYAAGTPLVRDISILTARRV